MIDEDKKLERIKVKKMREMFRSRTVKNEQNLATTTKPIELTDATFAEAIHTHPCVTVDCWAPWCGPCHMISPIIEELARDYASNFFFW